MNKKMLTIVTATVIALSCFTAIAIDSVETDAIAGPNQGDAWGYGATFDKQDILDAIYDSLEKQGIDVNESTAEKEIVDMIEAAIRVYTGADVDFGDTDISGEIWAIHGITEKNANGYVMDLAAAFSLGTSLSATVGFTDDGKRETLILEKMALSVDAFIKGKAYLDRDFALTSMELDMGAYIKTDIRANIEQIGDDLEITDRMNDHSYYLNVDGGFNITFDGEPMQIVSSGDHRTIRGVLSGTSGYEFTVTSNIPDVDNRTERDTEHFDDLEYAVYIKNVDGTDYMYPTFKDLDDIIDIDLDIPLDISDMVFYTYPFEDNRLIPDGFLINGDLKLDDSSERMVRGNIDRIIGDSNNDMEKMTFTVTFLDVHDNELKVLKDVPYGSTIDLPNDYDGMIVTDDDGDREMFVGWETADDIIWKPEYKVKGNLILEPEFADMVSDDRRPDKGDFVNNPNVIWDLKHDSHFISEAIDNNLLNGQNTLFVSITDEDGRILYKWRISAGSTGASIIPEVKEKDVPDRDYINAVTDGKASMYLDFSASGTMPDGTYVSYYVGDRFADGSTVQIYYDNERTGTADHSGSAIVGNGYIDIDLAHCSSYIVVGDAGSSGSNMMLIVGAVIVVLVVAVAAIVLLRSRKNNTA